MLRFVMCFQNHCSNLINPFQILLSREGKSFGKNRDTKAKNNTISQNPVEPIKSPEDPHMARCLFVANHKIAAVGTAKNAAANCPMIKLEIGPSDE
jgi:hypothetical protein